MTIEGIAAIAALLTSISAFVGYQVQRKSDQEKNALAREQAEVAKEQAEQALFDKVWKMSQDNIKALQQDRDRLAEKVETLQLAIDIERDKRRAVELQLQNLMLAVNNAQTGLVLLAGQIVEMGGEPRWEPPKDLFNVGNW